MLSLFQQFVYISHAIIKQGMASIFFIMVVVFTML